MEENIIGEIAKAEEEAAKRKSAGMERAAALLSEAEKSASELLKAAETDCAMLRADGIRKAEAEASAEYDRTVALAARNAKEYADGLLAHTDVAVAEIVGRLTK